MDNNYMVENFRNEKINFEERWFSPEWDNLDTHTQILSKMKFISFLLNNLQIRNHENGFILKEYQTDRINKKIDPINKKIFNNI